MGSRRLACLVLVACGRTELDMHSVVPEATDAGTLPSILAGHVAVGAGHACAIDTQERLACWGDDTNGQLGDGRSNTQSFTPVLVALEGVQWVTAAENHTCAIVRDGTLSCWGYGVHGEIGNGGTGIAASPTPVTGAFGASQVVAGDAHVCALVRGNVRCWGSNAAGQLGTGGANVDVPVDVPGLSDIVEIGAGGGHTCAVRSSGAVLCWGSNDHGELGDGTTTGRPLPQPVSGLTDAVQLAVGQAQTCALTSSGTLLCWGDDSDGQLGGAPLMNLSCGPCSWIPQVVPLLGARAVAAGAAQTCAIVDTTVWCWGAAGSDLGTGATYGNTASPPAPADDAMGNVLSGFVGLATGLESTCALAEDGGVWCWGYDEFGELGVPTPMEEPHPARVVGFP